VSDTIASGLVVTLLVASISKPNQNAQENAIFRFFRRILRWGMALFSSIIALSVYIPALNASVEKINDSISLIISFSAAFILFILKRRTDNNNNNNNNAANTTV
jgi:hypothetical protein